MDKLKYVSKTIMVTGQQEQDALIIYWKWRAKQDNRDNGERMRSVQGENNGRQWVWSGVCAWLGMLDSSLICGGAVDSAAASQLRVDPELNFLSRQNFRGFFKALRFLPTA